MSESTHSKINFKKVLYEYYCSLRGGFFQGDIKQVVQIKIYSAKVDTINFECDKFFPKDFILDMTIGDLPVALNVKMCIKEKDADNLYRCEAATIDTELNLSKLLSDADLRKNRQTHAIAKPTVLVVDDEDDLRNIVSEVLAESGFDVMQAEHSQAALEILNGRTIDVVLCDIMMPGMTGDELFAVCKESLSIMPVFFFMTGYSKYSKDSAFDHGAAGHFSKPFSFSQMANVIKATLDDTPRSANHENEQRQIGEPRTFSVCSNGLWLLVDKEDDEKTHLIKTA